MIENLFVFDAHCDTVHRMFINAVDFGKNRGHLDSVKAQAGGLSAQIFALYVDPVFSTTGALKRALMLLQHFHKNIIEPGFGTLVTSVNEMDREVKAGRLACWLLLEGGHILENSIEMLDIFYSLGVRLMTLTHTKHTDWADCSNEPPRWQGLNALGIKMVRRMEALKMIIDVSHTSDDTVRDVLENTSSPVMASHSCSRALCNISRNLPDTLIRAIASRNGFIGVSFFPAFLQQRIFDQINENFKKHHDDVLNELDEDKDDPESVSHAEWKLYEVAVLGNNPVDMNSVIDHIDHIAQIGGVDCVGLGSDFDGIPSTPSDLFDVSRYPDLAEGLTKRGFKEEQIRKVMGGNLRAFLSGFDGSSSNNEEE